MAEKKAKAPAFRLRGTFKYPKLGTADTKFKPAGEFSVKVIATAESAAALTAKLKPFHDKAIEEGKTAYAALPVATRKKTEFKVQPLSTPVYDDSEQETGEVEFKFTMTASGEFKTGPKTGQKWHRKPDVFDAKGVKMDGNKVWSGSVGIVAFEVGNPYYTTAAGAGISLRLQAAQVIELVSGGQKSAGNYGFEAEEGYEDEGGALPEETKAGEAQTAGDGSADF